MKVVIFAGGLGTRISEESHLRPKPMIEIGGKPILWHIMKMYSAYGYNDFIICLGYKGYMIKEYFLNYFIHNSNVTIDLTNNDVQIHSTESEPFKVTMIETGLNTKTAGRLKQVLPYIDSDYFMLTYGDGVANINFHELVAFHQQKNKLCTMTSIIPEGRFGTMDIDELDIVRNFKEKPKDDNHWVNGGFFVLNRNIIDYLQGDMTNVMWEQEPLVTLTKNRELVTYKHRGFWKCMDAMRDKTELDELWNTGKAPWKIWK
jgi:glucose-1-phosphate cytidylyltransferase